MKVLKQAITISSFILKAANDKQFLTTGFKKMQNIALERLFSAQPGVAIVKYWQGVVEMVLRGTAIVSFSDTILKAVLQFFVKQVLAFISFAITARVVTLLNAVIQSLHPFIYSGYYTARNSAGWLIFVQLVAMLYEGLVIALRFINFNFVNAYSKIAFIVVRIFSWQLYS